MHLESSKLLPDELARLLLPLGTTAVVADPHEIANVLGTDGVHWLLDFCADLPLEVWFMASSCVPASTFESPRRALNDGDLGALLRRRRVLGLAEMMNFPGVIGGAEHELSKLRLDGATHVDGHAPGVIGKELNAYIAAGHPLRPRGAHARGGPPAAARGHVGADPRGVAARATCRRCCRSSPSSGRTGSRSARTTASRSTSSREGHINSMVRAAVAAGVAPEDALVIASFNGATWHGLSHLGALAPGYQADVLVLSDLESFEPELVLKAGRRVDETERREVPDWVRHTVRIRPFGPNRFRIPWEGGAARVIGLVPDQIVTDSLVEEPTVVDGDAVADPERDLAKIAVLERHLGTGRMGLGFVRGFGLKTRRARLDGRARRAQHRRRGRRRLRHVARRARGWPRSAAGSSSSRTAACAPSCALPIAGLLSAAELEEVVESSRGCVEAARKLGCELRSPFQSLAFLALSVIPALKITDRGVIDVDRFEVVPLRAG